LFMMECSSCKVKFHGTCINVSEFDVTDNVLWVCSPNCEDDVPIGLKTTKKVVVGSKKRNAAKKDSPSPDNIPTPQTKSQQHQLCMALCKYKRKASSGQFMVECENCKVWFHGSCMGLCQRDVASDDVIWVCSSQCEDDIPVGSKHEKKLLVGSAVCKSDSCIRSKHHDKAKGAGDVPPNVDDEQPLSSQNQLLPSSDEVACRTIQNADHGVSKDQFIESKSDISCDLDSCAKVNSSVEPNEDSNCSVMAGSKRWCIPECRYGRSAECDRFMVECSGCKEWFHGKCVCVRERDVDGEDVLWLCTAACEDEFPAIMKVGKRLVIGSLLLDNRKKLDQPNQEESKQDQKLSTCKAETSRKEKRKACSDLESSQNTIINNVEIADRGKSVSKRKRGNICEVSTSCEEKSQGGQESVVIRDSALCKFLGISTGSNSTRSKVNAFVLAYLKRKELLDKSDHMMCLPNDKLRKVFDLPERCTLKKVAKRIKALLVKESDKGSMSTPRTPLARSMLSYESKSPFSNEKGHANLFAEPGIRLFEERSSSVLHETNATFDDEDDDVPLFAANSNQFTYRGQPTADTTSECHAATDSNEQILTSHDAIAVDTSSESGCIIRSYSETECHSQVTANSEENTPSADLASLAKADSADNVNAEENERGSVELQCLSDLNHSGCFIPSDSGIELIKKSKESIHLDDLEAQMKAGSDLSDDVDAELNLIASVEHKSVSVSNAEADVLLPSCLKARSTIPSLQSAEAELGGSQMLITHEPETANDMVNVVHHPCRDLVPMQQDCAQQVAVAEEILSEETHQDRADTMVDLEHSVCPLSSSCLDPSEKGASNESIVINKEQGPESRGGANISKAFTLKAADDHAVEEPLKAADDRAVEEPMQDDEDDSVDPSLLEMLEQGALSNAQSADDDDFVSMQDLEMLEAGAASV
jgi:chromatin remodeling complex protein RSC6